MTVGQAVAYALMAEESETGGSSAGVPLSGRHRSGADVPGSLTAREVEVLRLVAAGHSSKEIAAALGAAVPTINRHIANIYAKIGARGRADAIAYAFRHGLSQN
jgi:DNA-binding CsgD family transcriptional regulator